jgi:hypothetical protein
MCPILLYVGKHGIIRCTSQSILHRPFPAGEGYVRLSVSPGPRPAAERMDLRFDKVARELEDDDQEGAQALTAKAGSTPGRRAGKVGQRHDRQQDINTKHWRGTLHQQLRLTLSLPVGFLTTAQ